MRSGERGPHGLQRAAALLLIGASLTSLACTGPAGTARDVITVAVPSSPNNLDPRIGTDEISQRIQQLIYTPLLALDERMRVVGGLASGWDTPDERTYIVHLRTGVPFHDGRELTSADVVYTFGSLLDPAFVSPRKGAYRMVETVTALDRYTVRFTLKEPFSSFPVNLVLPVVPAGSGASLGTAPVGTGPYRFAGFAVDDRITLAPFPGHFAGAPRNGGVVVKVVPDDIMRGLELRKGTVDLVVNDLAPDIVHQLRQEGLAATESPGTDYQYLGFNLRDPVLRDRRVRHAIGHALDREAIVTYLRRGLATPASGLLPPMSWAFEPDVFVFSHDPATAARLLDEAGYPDPDGAGPRPRLSLSLKVSSAEFNRLQSAVIQQDLAAVGIAVDVRTYEFATLYADVLRGTFQMFTLQWVGGSTADPDILRRVFHSEQTPPLGFNRGHFAHAEVDRLIDAAAVTVDEAARQRLYAEAQRIIAVEAPYVSLWTKINVAVYQPDLRNVRLGAAADFSFLRDVYRAGDGGARHRAGD